MESYIILQGLRFYAHHGVGAQETCVGNEFTVDLRLQADWSDAARTDKVNDTVSYADVFASVQDEMARPSKLLEHVANRIVSRLFQDFPAIQSVELKLMKRNPPMGADIEACGVDMKRWREDG